MIDMNDMNEEWDDLLAIISRLECNGIDTQLVVDEFSRLHSGLNGNSREDSLRMALSKFGYLSAKPIMDDIEYNEIILAQDLMQP